MRVKLTNPDHAAGLKDPHTKRTPFLDAETGEVLDEADVPENNHWLRRVGDGSVVRVKESAHPSGHEPIAPLTTRSRS